MQEEPVAAVVAQRSIFRPTVVDSVEEVDIVAVVNVDKRGRESEDIGGVV